MNCQEYLALFSDHRDGVVDARMASKLEAHRSVCAECDRYSMTLEAGLQLLKDLPPIEVPSDFRPRLDHRIYHIEDGESIARETLGTGATTVSVLAMAVLLALAAWTPSMRKGSSAVELPTLVVQSPGAQTFTRRTRSSTFPRGLSLYPSTEFQDGFWGSPPQLLFEFSTFSERRRTSAFAGFAIE